MCMHKQVRTRSLSKVTHTVLGCLALLKAGGHRWMETDGHWRHENNLPLQRVSPILHTPFSSCPSPPQPTQHHPLRLLASLFSSRPLSSPSSSPLPQSSSPHWVHEGSLYTVSQRPFSYPKPPSRVLWTPGWLPPWEEFCCQLFR